MRLVVASACWVAGVYLGLQGDLPALPVAMFLVASLVLGVIFAINRWTIVVPVGLLLLLLGALRTELTVPLAKDLVPYYGLSNVQIEGVVVDDPEPRGSVVRFLLQVEAIDSGDDRLPARGKALVLARPSARLVRERSAPYIRYGDKLWLTGSPETPPSFGDFDYGEYLARQGISSTLNLPEVTLLEGGHGSPVLSAIYRLRNSLARSLDRSLAESPASLAEALLLGRRGGISGEVTQTFRDTGTSHLLAISGLHVGVVLALTLPLSQALLGRRRNLYLLMPLGLLWLYAVLSGLSASVERAVIMASLYLLALALAGRRDGRPGPQRPLRRLLPAQLYRCCGNHLAGALSTAGTGHSAGEGRLLHQMEAGRLPVAAPAGLRQHGGNPGDAAPPGVQLSPDRPSEPPGNPAHAASPADSSGRFVGYGSRGPCGSIPGPGGGPGGLAAALLYPWHCGWACSNTSGRPSTG